jgi:hypothetical protein
MNKPEPKTATYTCIGEMMIRKRQLWVCVWSSQAAKLLVSTVDAFRISGIIN